MNIPIFILYYNPIKENQKGIFIQLTAKNPQAPRRKVEYDFETGSFSRVRMIDSMIDHLEIESVCFHKYSIEARKQAQEGNANIWLNKFFLNKIRTIKIYLFHKYLFEI